MNGVVFFLLRVAIGTSMFTHGLVRLPKLTSFSNWMVGNFEKSILPEALVRPFSYGLPVIEFLTGLLLIIGLFTRQALIAGGLVMIALIFGTGITENWDALPSQLIHTAFFGLLLQFITGNKWALDGAIKK